MQYNLVSVEEVVLGAVVSYVYDEVQNLRLENFCKDTVFCLYCKEMSLHL